MCSVHIQNAKFARIRRYCRHGSSGEPVETAGRPVLSQLKQSCEMWVYSPKSMIFFMNSSNSLRVHLRVNRFASPLPASTVHEKNVCEVCMKSLRMTFLSKFSGGRPRRTPVFRPFDVPVLPNTGSSTFRQASWPWLRIPTVLSD